MMLGVVTHCCTKLVISNVTKAPDVVIGMLLKNGAAVVGLVFHVTAGSLHALVTCAMSRPPVVNTLFANTVSEAF